METKGSRQKGMDGNSKGGSGQTKRAVKPEKKKKKKKKKYLFNETRMGRYTSY
jgi:hypothetical protein